MPVDLAANALIDETELASYMGAGSTIVADDARRVINRASDLLCEWLGRTLITPGSDLVEFHTVARAEHELLLLDWPIVTVTSVHEDTTREYAAASLLTTDQYIVSKPGGKLIRVEALSGASSWLPGFRAIRVAYKPGYAIANVPARYKDAVGQIAAILWGEKKRGNWGVTGMSDGQGNFTRLSASHLPAYITEPIEADRAPRGHRTGERDA